MIESYISAEAECTERVDVNPDKVLRPIGTVFKVWAECLNSTEPPHWTWWKVVGYVETFRGTRGDNVLAYERMEEVEATEGKE